MRKTSDDKNNKSSGANNSGFKKFQEQLKTGKILPFKTKDAWKHEFLKNRLLQVNVAVFALIWIAAAIKPYDRFDWLLENLPVFAAAAVFVFTYKNFRFSNISYILITVFITLHVIGANYSYTTTPVDNLMKTLFGSTRDNYDRLVHFSYGLLITYPICELLLKKFKIRGVWAAAIALCVILGTGAFYEITEMWVARIVAPELGDLFLGTQGDLWDAQKDMEISLYGWILAAPLSVAPFRHITVIKCTKKML